MPAAASRAAPPLGLRNRIEPMHRAKKDAAEAVGEAAICEGASGRAWRLTPARHCASCASTSVEVDASRSERMPSPRCQSPPSPT